MKSNKRHSSGTSSMRLFATTRSYLLCVGLFVGVEGIPAQTLATIKADKASLTAGEALTTHVRLDKPPSYEAQINIVFSNSDQSDSFYLVGKSLPGQFEADVSGLVPPDAKGGIYTSSRGIMGAAPGYRNNHPFTVNKVDITVVPLPDHNTYPSGAQISLTLSQKQFLRTSAVSLQAVLDELIEGLDKASAMTPALRAILVKTLRSAQKQLSNAELDYAVVVGKSLDSHPVLFDDFARRYEAALIQLKAPANASLDEVETRRPHLVLAQLSGHKNDPIAEKPNYHGSYPLEAERVVDLIEENIAAYKRIETTASDSFTIHLGSRPPGASISYARVGETFKDYSAVTDVDATLPLARWTFRFAKPGCRVVLRSPDPFIERQPDLTVELTCSPK